MVSNNEGFLSGKPVVARRQLNPREHHVGLYLWGTIVWHLLILLGTVTLLAVGPVLF